MIKKLDTEWYAVENMKYSHEDYIDFFIWLSGKKHNSKTVFPDFLFSFLDEADDGEFHNRWGHLLNWSQYESV